MKILTDNIRQRLEEYDPEVVESIYNGLDAAVTLEIFYAIKDSLDEHQRWTYDFVRQMQAPALEMMRRGLRIDHALAGELRGEMRHRLNRNQSNLNKLAEALWGKGLNANSPKQVKAFFYNILGLPVQYKAVKGELKETAERKALEALELYYYAQPFVKHILVCRDLAKRLSVLSKRLDEDGRIRTSYNVAGTESGRWSSSSSAFNTGDNLQNWEDYLRRVIISDPGMKFAYIDLQQAESKGVAYLSGDEAYIEACNSSDPHTTVCKMVWKNLDWNGDPKHDRQVADEKFYREFTYRDLAKRAGHGCVTPDHEVLTRTGWVPITDKPKEIMIYKNKALRWGEPSHWTDKHWEGTLTHLTGNSISAKLTSDHRVVFVRDQTSEILHVEPASAFSRKGCIPLGKGYSGTRNVPEAKLIAAYQCDGHQASTNRVAFHMHKERKFERLEDLAAEYGIGYTRNQDKARLHWECNWPKKAGAYLLDWDQESLIAYLTEHKHWDGHVGSTNSTSLSSIDREHLEWLQTIGRLVGIGGNFQIPRTSGFGSTIHRIQQNNRKFAQKDRINKTLEEYSGRVLCPTVESGAFLIRHNGKISVTGNSNYLGKPTTIAKNIGVQVQVAEQFQYQYFSAFNKIPEWHTKVAQLVQTTGYMHGPYITARRFLGRRLDDATLREAIAHGPQSMIGNILNTALLKVWKAEKTLGVKIAAQLHDAILIQYPERLEAEILPEVLKTMLVPVEINGRTMTINLDAQVGWNWGHKTSDNPDGLQGWSPEKPDNRKRLRSANESILDTKLHKIY